MVKKRVIPCLDVAGGRVVKGVNFVDLREMGEPIELATRYSELGADELVFLDITATLEGRGPILELIERAAAELTIPFTVGGGVTGLEDARSLLRAGADKVAVNRAAFDDPSILTALADEFGSQAVVCAIDAKAGEVVTHAGKTPARPRRRRLGASRRSTVAPASCSSPRSTPTARGPGYDLPLTRAVRRGGRGARDRLRWSGRGGPPGRRVRGRSRGGDRRLDRARAARAAARVESRAEGGGMERPDLSPAELMPAIVQDAATGRVLMLAWMDEEALRRTRETGEAWFWSRSRQEYWHKGATSGNTMAVVEVRDDCDGDAILLRVDPAGPACHTGAESCFAPWLWRVVAERAATRPEGSYVAGLLERGTSPPWRRRWGRRASRRRSPPSPTPTSASSRSSPTSGSTATCCSPRAASIPSGSRRSSAAATAGWTAAGQRRLPTATSRRSAWSSPATDAAAARSRRCRSVSGRPESGDEHDLGSLHLVRLGLVEPLGAEREEHVPLVRGLRRIDVERPEVLERRAPRSRSPRATRELPASAAVSPSSIMPPGSSSVMRRTPCFHWRTSTTSRCRRDGDDERVVREDADEVVVHDRGRSAGGSVSRRTL